MAMETDNKMNTTTPENEEKIPQKCGCRWEKVTKFRGLRIHQGKQKCGQKGQQQPCTALAGETSGTESQVENHRADGPNVAEGKDVTEEEGPLVEGEPPREYQDPVATKSQRTETKAETKKPTIRGKLKWPKASKTEAWRTLDNDLRHWRDLCEGGRNPSSTRLAISFTRPARTGLAK